MRYFSKITENPIKDSLEKFNLKSLFRIITPLLILTFLFHNSKSLSLFLLEGWCIIVATALFIFIRKSENFYHNYYLLILSYVYIGVAIIDTYHIMIHINVYFKEEHYGSLYDQYWMASRYIESIGILTAYYFSQKKLFRGFIKWQYPTSALLLIFLLSSDLLSVKNNIPFLFVVFSNSGFCILFLFAAILLLKKRQPDNPVIYQTIAISFLFSAFAEILFLFDHKNLISLIAHYFRALSYLFLFNGVVVEGMVTPFKKLKDTEKALRKEQLLYSQTLAAVKDGLIRVFPDKKEMEVSLVWEDMTGYQFEHHRLNFRQIAAIIHPYDKKNVLKAYKNLLRTSFPFKQEFRILHREGHWFWVLVRGKIFSSEESGLYFLGIMTDISRRKMIEKELVRAKDKAEEADRLKSAFLANMSHEIRTPLNVILGFSSLLVKDIESDDSDESDEKQSYVKLIRQSSDQLISIITDLIDISRIQNNQIQLNVVKINLTDFLKNMFMVYRQLMDDQGKNHLRLSWSVPDNFQENLFLLADLDRFNQIWQNLLNNAMKFTEFGQIVFGIYRFDEKSIVFFVKDTGPGILPGQEDVIFDRFRQGEEGFSKQYRGSGLGLAIAKELLNLMKGEILVDTEYKKGASFLFTLPGTLVLHE